MTPNINDLFVSVRFQRIFDLLQRELKPSVDKNELFECIHQFLHLCDNAKEIAPEYAEIATWVETFKRLSCYQISKEILTLDRYRTLLLSPDVITKFIYRLFGLREIPFLKNRCNDYDQQFKTGSSYIYNLTDSRNEAAHQAKNYYSDRVNALKKIEPYLDIFIMMFYVIKYTNKRKLIDNAIKIIERGNFSTTIRINILVSANIEINDINVVAGNQPCHTETKNGTKIFKVERFKQYCIKCGEWESDTIVFDEGYISETTIEIAPPKTSIPNGKLDLKKIILSENNSDYFSNEFPSLIKLITDAEKKSEETYQCALKVAKAALVYIASEGNNNCLDQEIQNLSEVIFKTENISKSIDAKVDEFHKKLSSSGPDFEKYCELLDDLYDSTIGVFEVSEAKLFIEQIVANAKQLADGGKFNIANSMITQIINRQKELTKIFYGIKNINVSHNALLDEFNSKADEFSRELQPLINNLSSAISNLDSYKTEDDNNVVDKIGPWISVIRWAFGYADQRYQLLFLIYNRNIIETLLLNLSETISSDDGLYKELFDAYESVIRIIDSHKLSIDSKLSADYTSDLMKLKKNFSELNQNLKQLDNQSPYLSILETISRMSNEALAILLMINNGNAIREILSGIDAVIENHNIFVKDNPGSKQTVINNTSFIYNMVDDLQEKLVPKFQVSNDESDAVCKEIISAIGKKYSPIPDYIKSIIEMTRLNIENPWLKSYLLINALAPDAENSCRLAIVESLKSIDKFNNMSWGLKDSVCGYLYKNASELIKDIKSLNSTDLQIYYLQALMQIDVYNIFPHKKIEIFYEIFLFLKINQIISFDDFYDSLVLFLRNTTKLNSLDSLDIEHLVYLREMAINDEYFGLKENWIKDLNTRIIYIERDNAKSTLVTMRRIVSTIRTSNLPNLCDEIINVRWAQSSEQEMEFVEKLWKQIFSKLKEAKEKERTDAIDNLCDFLVNTNRYTIDYKLSTFESLNKYMTNDQKKSFIERLLNSTYNTLTFDKTKSPNWKIVSENIGKLIDWANSPNIEFNNDIRLKNWVKDKYVIDNIID